MGDTRNRATFATIHVYMCTNILSTNVALDCFFKYLYLFVCFVRWCLAPLILLIRSLRHGRDRMVAGFTTTYPISAYHY
jgi:hypothetical protein